MCVCVCVCVYNWIILLLIWNYHNIVNQLYPNIKYRVKKRVNSNCIIVSKKKNIEVAPNLALDLRI